MERKLTSIELKDSVEELLQISTMTIATRGVGGEPHAAAVYYACDEQLNFIFFSDAQSQHSRDIAHDPRVAVTVHPNNSAWQNIHGLQLRGEAAPVQNRAIWQQAWERYADKFPFVRQLEEIVSENQMYLFTPKWMRLVDNRKGFGYKQEWRRDNARGAGDEKTLWNRTDNESGSSGSVNG
jgi:uncharacterized protein YhbP (UPF0306 family)